MTIREIQDTGHRCAERGLPDGAGHVPMHVRKPIRYIGREVNMVNKDPGAVNARIALAFPDTYEVGMSHLGLKLLYGIINRYPHFWAERVFAVWPDMEQSLRERRRLLGTLESGTPLRELDVIGFSLQYELCATNVLQMLDLGGIPRRTEDRGEGDPFVIAGGPLMFNPGPLAPFFDAIALGDGEELIVELLDILARWKREGGSREALLTAWKAVEGLYVPALSGPHDMIRRRLCPDLQALAYPTELVVPYCDIVHDRVGIEIARGCTRGCRFCQAGMLYRPVRERSPERVLGLARESLAKTGWDEVSLLSLSSGDYGHIGALVQSMVDNFGPEHIAVSLPSLRPETLERGMAEAIRTVRKTGFTLAPEAGTERLRRVINKGNTEDDLERAVTTAFRAGWQSLKLYFMIGLPTEDDDDLDAIADLIHRAGRWARGGKITGSVSTFVPKAHTPFQWAEQISPDEIRRRQQHIKRRFTRGRHRLKFHHPASTFLEGIIARGDHRLSAVIERAYDNGARFDGWDEHVNLERWEEALEHAGLDPASCLGARTPGESLPWDFVATGVEPAYLVREWNRAVQGTSTADCRHGECRECGVCDFHTVFPRVQVPPEISSLAREQVRGADVSWHRYRLRFGKQGVTRLLGHHDVTRTFHRAFRRAGLTLRFSEGFHPQPRLRFSPPPPVGVESVAEYLDFDILEAGLGTDELLQKLQCALPEGLSPLELTEIPLNNPPVSARIGQVEYHVRSAGAISLDFMAERVQWFRSVSEVPVTRERKGTVKQRNLKDWIECLDITATGMRLKLKVTDGGTVNPYDAMAGVLGIDRTDLEGLWVMKTSATVNDWGAT